jgi:hypothetical protein
MKEVELFPIVLKSGECSLPNLASGEPFPENKILNYQQVQG